MAVAALLSRLLHSRPVHMRVGMDPNSFFLRLADSSICSSAALARLPEMFTENRQLRSDLSSSGIDRRCDFAFRTRESEHHRVGCTSRPQSLCDAEQIGNACVVRGGVISSRNLHRRAFAFVMF